MLLHKNDGFEKQAIHSLALYSVFPIMMQPLAAMASCIVDLTIYRQFSQDGKCPYDVSISEIYSEKYHNCVYHRVYVFSSTVQ